VSDRFNDSAHDALENLVEQFSDVYCFYRELIQNSLDAGTNRVDVELEYRPHENPELDGVMIIHVDDYGEGMNREIIDSQLTKLFSSGKENDRTKIGKFGIGFVSVFAIKPDLVNIDTSRDGEDWRVIFNQDKSFQRFKRNYPVDGTKIQIVKTCGKKFFETFREKSLQTVRYWCRYSEADIYFDGEKINEPFDINTPVKIHVKKASDEVVAGYTSQNPPFFGFYNKGLTLLEGNRLYFPFVTFKLKSKFLEHTLTRDNVRENENYFKAMDFLETIITEKLPRKLFETIESELVNHTVESELYKEILQDEIICLANPEKLPKDCLDRKIARNTEGGFVTVSELLNLRKEDCFLFDTGSNPVTRALHSVNRIVIKTSVNSELHKNLLSLAGLFWKKPLVIQASSVFFVTKVIDQENLTGTHKDLIKAVENINREMSARTNPITFASFAYEGSCIKDKICVVQKNPGQLTPLYELNKKGKVVAGRFDFFSRTDTLVLNDDHPYIRGILNLSIKDRNLAAYLLTKLLYMDDGIETETDVKLASVALERSQN
jgi:molecular chaperone HtpG